MCLNIRTCRYILNIDQPGDRGFNIIIYLCYINPVISYTLDSRLREGNTYLERSVLGVSLDSGFTEGASCLEPLEQSVLSSSLVARPIEGITEKVSDWKPVINQDITPDGRPMEGTAYPEHSALGVSLDSGLRAGMSSLEPLQQSVLNSLFGDRHARASGSGTASDIRN